MLPTPTSPTSAPVATARKKPRKSRGRGLRTTTGCTTCRGRHMKCDEVKPTCGPCARSGRNCVFQTPTLQRTSKRSSDTEETIEPQLSNHVQTGLNVSDAPVEDLNELADAVVTSTPSEGPDQTQLDEAPRLHWASPSGLDGYQITSPRSTISSGWGLDVAPLRWFDLLAGDANANDDDFSMDLLSWRQAVATPQMSRHDSMGRNVEPGGFAEQSLPLETPAPVLAPLLPPPTPSTIDLLPVEKEPWQVSIQLLDHEIPLFRRFVDRLGLWLDVFDPMKHFSTFVPHLAVANEGLMKAILALGARHLSIKPSEGLNLDRTAAVQYYYETLHYLQKAMKYESYNRSLELTATALIVSTYEMVDGAGKGWERHLKGVFWIQRSRNIGAESLGLEGAGWWAWLRQDVWAAFRERRRVYSFHRPTKRYEDMNQYDLASKSVYLLAQTINYSSDQDVKEGGNNLHARIDRARILLEMLEEWYRSLTVHFAQLPFSCGPKSVFNPIWINPAPLATAIQMYHFARILLLVHQPAAGGFNEFLQRERQMSEAVDTISGVAMTITDEPSTISSTQCLYAAGLYTHDKDPQKREAIVKLIDAHQMRTGWPVSSLTEELQAEWTVAVSK